MRSSAYLLAIFFALVLGAASQAQAQKEMANPQAIASAKTIYFDDKSGVDAVGKKARAELSKWGRFQIVSDRKKADLIFVLSTDPKGAGNLILSGGQTGRIDSRGHVEEDPIPQYNKLASVRYAFLTLIDAETGTNLWSDSQRWGGLLTGFDSVGEHLVQEFEKQMQTAERRARLKLIKSVNPAFPEAARKQHIEGTVVVRIVVDKNGKVTAAKALSGPTELFQPSVEAAKGSNPLILKEWRRGWDSNPRYGFPHARFRGEYFKPLSHLSAVVASSILAEPAIFRQSIAEARVSARLAPFCKERLNRRSAFFGENTKSDFHLMVEPRVGQNLEVGVHRAAVRVIRAVD